MPTSRRPTPNALPSSPDPAEPSEPGPTPGQAEGERDPDQQSSPNSPARTPGQAEGCASGFMARCANEVR